MFREGESFVLHINLLVASHVVKVGAMLLVEQIHLDRARLLNEVNEFIYFVSTIRSSGQPHLYAFFTLWQFPICQFLS